MYLCVCMCVYLQPLRTWAELSYKKILLFSLFYPLSPHCTPQSACPSFFYIEINTILDLSSFLSLSLFRGDIYFFRRRAKKRGFFLCLCLSGRGNPFLFFFCCIPGMELVNVDRSSFSFDQVEVEIPAGQLFARRFLKTVLVGQEDQKESTKTFISINLLTHDKQRTGGAGHPPFSWLIFNDHEFYSFSWKSWLYYTYISKYLNIQIYVCRCGMSATYLGGHYFRLRPLLTLSMNTYNRL